MPQGTGEYHAFLLAQPQKKNMIGKKTKDQGENRTHEHWNDRISTTCNQIRKSILGRNQNYRVLVPWKRPLNFDSDQLDG